MPLQVAVRILLYMRPHTTIYVSSYYYICVRILPYMCPHTAVYLSSCAFNSVLRYTYLLVACSVTRFRYRSIFKNFLKDVPCHVALFVAFYLAFLFL